MTDRPTEGLPERITVWACPVCGYWRQDRSTGVHVDFPHTGPEDRHELVEIEYVPRPTEGETR